MSERSGLHSVLERSRVYTFMQTGIGRAATPRHLQDAYFPGLGHSLRRVLDIGCGPAQFLVSWPVEGIEFVGFDPNAEYITTGRQAHPKATLLVGTCATVADEISGSFDLAVSFGVLHHVDDEEAKRIAQFAFDRLAPGGRFVALDPTLLPRQNPIARLLAKSDRGKHVRGPQEYQALVASVFGDDVQSHVESRLLRVPYNHSVVVANKH